MKDKTKAYPHDNEKLKASGVTHLGQQNQTLAIFETTTNNKKSTTVNRTKNSTKVIEEEEKKFKQKIDSRKQLGIYSQEEENNIGLSDNEKIENAIEANFLRVDQEIRNNKLLKRFRSLSSSALYEKRNKPENINETNDFLKLNFKSCETNCNRNKINPNKNHGKTARGILFLNKKRKFLLNCLFGKNEVYKYSQKTGKQSVSSDFSSTRKSIPFLSKSLDDVLLFYRQEVKFVADNSTTLNQIQDDLKGKHYSELPSSSSQESDYEMIMLFLSHKDQEEGSCNKKHSKEFIDKLFLQSTFKKNNLLNIHPKNIETNLKQKNNFEVKVQKKDNSELENVSSQFNKGKLKENDTNVGISHQKDFESNLKPKIILEENNPIRNTSRDFPHSSEAGSHLSKTSSTEIHNHLSEDKKKLDIKAISDTFNNSNKSPLCSLLSFFNSALSATGATSSSEGPPDEQSTSSCQGNCSVKESQSKIFINSHKNTQKLNYSKILKDQLLPQDPLYTLNEKSTKHSQELGTCKENFQDFHCLKNQGQSDQPLFLKNTNNINLTGEQTVENSLNACPLTTGEPNSLNYENIRGNPTEYCNNITEKTSGKRNRFPRLDVPHVLADRYNFINVNNYKSNEIPLKEEKECITTRQNHFYADSSNKYNEPDANEHNEESTKMCSFKSNKQTEDEFYSSFKRQYIPVPKSIHENKDSSIKSVDTRTSVSSPNKSLDALNDNMCLMNPDLFNKCLIQESQNNRQFVIAEDGIVENRDDGTSETLERMTKNENETISFTQDFHINLQNSHPERDRIRHYTEVMKNKTLQKSFKYGADSLKFELQFLDTIYTRRLEQAKKLTHNLSKNYNIEQANDGTPQSINRAPAKVSEYATNTPGSSFIYSSQNTKLNYMKIDNNDASKTTYQTNSIQQDYSAFRQPINKCESDTNSKWSYDSNQTNSEFHAILSKEFKRDYIPVKGKRVKLSDANEEMVVVQQVENNVFRGEEKHHILCNVQMSHKEDEEETNQYFDGNKQKDIVVNIFLTRQDQKGSKLSFNLKNKIEERIDKHSSKISVCISEDSSDEVQEDEDDNEEVVNAIEEDGERTRAGTEFQFRKMPEQKLLPNIKDNTELKLNSEIPECKRALFPRIYSDFSIENKCNPVTYKYLLPNQPQ